MISYIEVSFNQYMHQNPTLKYCQKAEKTVPLRALAVLFRYLVLQFLCINGKITMIRLRNEYKAQKEIRVWIRSQSTKTAGFYL